MENEKSLEKCPMCGRGCSLEEVRCGRGRKYIIDINNKENGVEAVKEMKHSHEHKHRHEEFMKLNQEERLMAMLNKCGQKLSNREGRHKGKGRILKILNDKGSMTQSELQEYIDVRSASLSEILSKIESKGFIYREKDENDKRKVNITLTEEGRKIAKVNEEENDKNAKELFSCLKEEEQEQLEAILGKLLKDWRRYCRHGEGRHHDNVIHENKCNRDQKFKNHKECISDNIMEEKIEKE